MIGLRNALIDIYFLRHNTENGQCTKYCVPGLNNTLTLSVILSLYCVLIALKRNTFEALELSFKQKWKPYHTIQLVFSESTTPVALL